MIIQKFKKLIEIKIHIFFIKKIKMKSGLVKCMWEPLDFPRFSRRILPALCALKNVLHLRLKGSEAHSPLLKFITHFHTHLSLY